MFKVKTNPGNVAPWHHENTNRELVEMAREGRLGELGVIPAYMVPEKHKSIGEYVLADGHTRRAAACIAEKDIVLTIIEGQEDLNEILQWPGYSSNSADFETVRKNAVNRAIEYRTEGYFPQVLE